MSNGRVVDEMVKLTFTRRPRLYSQSAWGTLESATVDFVCRDCRASGHQFIHLTFFRTQLSTNTRNLISVVEVEKSVIPQFLLCFAF